MKQENKSKLSRLGNAHPLMDLPRGATPLEISILNSGLLFDLELPLAWKSLTWKSLTGLEIGRVERLWVY